MWIKARRILGILLVSAVFVLGNSGVASAEQALPDLNRNDCSITISPQSVDSHEIVRNTQFTAWRVGEGELQEGELRYLLTEEFAESEVELNERKAEHLIEELEQYIDSSEPEGITRTANEAGVVCFQNLSTGLYLLRQDAVATGDETVSPFLVTVPMEDFSGGACVYHVDASPKARVMERDEMKPEADASLPQTGQLNWPVPVLAAAGIAFFALGYGLRTKKR